MKQLSTTTLKGLYRYALYEKDYEIVEQVKKELERRGA